MTPKKPSKESPGATPAEGRAFFNPRWTKNSSGNGKEAASGEAQGFLLLGKLVIPLEKDKDVVLGRDNDACDLVLLNERISKRHSVITHENGRYFIEDGGSTNGTFVNRKRIAQRTPMVIGDKILVRPYELEFAGANHPLVAKSSQPALMSDASKHAGHFSGQLAVVPLTDVVQLLNGTRKSGILTIQDSENRRAKLVFSEGEILAATYSGTFAEEAVYKALAIKSGTFDFLPGQPPSALSPIQKKTISLLLEGCRLIDENSTPEPQIPPSPSGALKTRQLPRLEI